MNASKNDEPQIESFEIRKVGKNWSLWKPAAIIFALLFAITTIYILAGSNTAKDSLTAERTLLGDIYSAVKLASKDIFGGSQTSEQLTEIIDLSSSIALVPEKESRGAAVVAAPAKPIHSLLAQKNKILISEVMVGASDNNSYEFIELYNPTKEIIDLTDSSLRKKTSGGSESPLASGSRLKDKLIAPGKYLLLANAGGYTGSVEPDILWPKSYTLAYAKNSIILYGSDSSVIDSVSWENIPKGQSLERESSESQFFKIQPIPTPTNSQ